MLNIINFPQIGFIPSLVIQLNGHVSRDVVKPPPPKKKIKAALFVLCKVLGNVSAN